MSGDPGQANLTAACALADELALRGLEHAIVCPGSRSTPLALALATHPSIKTWVLIDERSAAFFALGRARQTKNPVAILCTSGTAAGNFLPAIVEANLSRIPLVALTADRPPELRDWGAAQTIDQVRIFGENVRWFVDMPVPDGHPALIRHTRATAARAMREARRRSGPVHLNLPFREPLLPVDLHPPLDFSPLYAGGRAGGKAIVGLEGHLVLDDATIDATADLISRTPRGVIVCGPGESAALPEAATRLARAAGYPILADPLSGLRFGRHDRSLVITRYDTVLRNPDTSAALTPDLVVRVGAPPTSKPLQQFLAACQAHHLLIDPGPPRDPSHLASTVLAADPADTLSRIAERISTQSATTTGSWQGAWLRADGMASAALTAALTMDADLSEVLVAVEVTRALPDGATLVVGNSMPVRDVDTFVRGDERQIRVVGTRGANGIDGVVSTAMGAAAGTNSPVVLLVGDLSFYHDLNGLLAAHRFGLSLMIVVINNDGGGIFSFLPQAAQLDDATFETLFGTPIGLDISTAAALYGAAYARPGNKVALRRDLARGLRHEGLSIVEVVTERQQNLLHHRELSAAVIAALRDARVPDLVHA